MEDIDHEKKAGPSPLLPDPRKSKSTRLTVFLGAITFAITLLFLVIATPQSLRNRLTPWLGCEPPERGWAVPSGSDGDEYLLGVGKADITGYVNDERSSIGYLIAN